MTYEINLRWLKSGITNHVEIDDFPSDDDDE